MCESRDGAESHGGAGQGVTLIRVVVRATERGKVLRDEWEM